jgi:hypothetical protein
MSSKRSRAAEVHNLSERVCTATTIVELLMKYWLLSMWSASLNEVTLHSCRDAEIGSMKRWGLCKSSYLVATRFSHLAEDQFLCIALHLVYLPLIMSFLLAFQFSVGQSFYVRWGNWVPEIASVASTGVYFLSYVSLGFP